ncbi:threo-3-hydroxy-L-aspartate ammonia-lyase [Martelella alba]|uniref:Threo-3-hydroxy-L-aspartate ammonia-lyase n=1 Tax=Martelella alba TaxID=2590451 RepID=A0A506U9G8_9HYPH|nr:threo-3-hydroxy-L-aspartate ammonia-lyase [Martelella alba]TPW29229.1 threo-3-hydroxy-L-aspartate ammonia-lyase [Martelella alba]
MPSTNALPFPDYSDVVAAASRIKGAAHETPVLTSTTADALTGAKLYFKAENFQRIGAFKFRGAYNAIAALTPEERARGVVTYSSGNHAQAVALASRLLGCAATIIMPADAPAVKMAATKGYGGTIHTYDRYTENRETIGAALAEEKGLTLIPPYDHPHVIAGQGTAAKELLEAAGTLDVLLAPLGGGGLLAGTALAAKAINPSIKVIGVEPEAGNDGQQSFRSGKIVEIAVPKTLADGAMTTHLGHYNFPIITEYVDDIVTVSDSDLVKAMAFFLERMKITVEPTGCLAAAAALFNIVPVTGKRVGIIISGGNIDITRIGTLLASQS